ncbi:MAG: hypothetical protein V4662_24330 [Verrucomicrobiota bacterium]
MNRRFLMICAVLSSMSLLSISRAAAGEVYSGEPLAEALHDLEKVASPVSHELSSTTTLVRTDVFRLVDGRLLAIMSKSRKLGEPFGIETLRVTSLTDSNLTKKLPPVESITLPSKR